MTTATQTHPTSAATRRTAPRRLAALVAGLTVTLASMLLAAPAALARDENLLIRPDREWHGFETWADGRLVDVQLIVDGQAAPLYFAHGRGDRHYLQAFAGRNYSVVLRNNTGARVAVLLAVDGLNAVDGERTKLSSGESMYVLAPWESATIRGWRTSLSEIRRFVFVDEKRSYAARTGQANSDMGWIRVLAFREQPQWWEKRDRDWGRMRSNYRDVNPGPLPPMAQASPVPNESEPQAGSRDSKDEANRSDAPEAKRQSVSPEGQEKLRAESDSRSFPGTGWGDRRVDHVRRVEFRAEPVATDHIVLRYEYGSALRALGIQPVRGPWQDRLGARDADLGFAKPPRW